MSAAAAGAPGFEIRPAGAEEVRPLRTAVLRPRQPEMMRYPEDPHALHLAAVPRGVPGAEPVGVVTVFRAPFPGTGEEAWQLRGMAVRPDLQGHGIGSLVLAAALHAVAAGGGGLLWCNARVAALDFYRRHGLATAGEEFEIIGIPHYRMRILIEPAG